MRPLTDIWKKTTPPAAGLASLGPSDTDPDDDVETVDPDEELDTSGSESTSTTSQDDSSPVSKRRKRTDELFRVDDVDVIASRTAPWVAAKNSKKRKSPDLDWKTEYPWIELVRIENGPIIGVLCRWCREVAATKTRADVRTLFQRSKMGFINKAITNWEKAGERLYKHEFGDKAPNAALYHGASGKNNLRRELKGKAECPTTHMQWREDYLNLLAVERSGRDVETCITLGGSHCADENRRSIQIMIRTLLKMIQQKSSPFFNFKREIDYLVLLQVPGIARLAGRYGSVLSIQGFTAALHMAVLYGIYVEMASACEPEEEISFAVLVDLASTSTTREWVAVCVRYVSAMSGGEICERLLKISRTSRKTGLAVMTSIAEAVAYFNDKMKELCQICPFLFPERGPKILSLTNCSAYGSDGGGGAFSKYISANCRIHEYNARICENWCGSHRVQLASKHASTKNDFLKDQYDATKKLQRLLTMSTEVDGMFKTSQTAILNIPTEKTISFCDVPMHKWETESDCLAKEAKLHEPIAATMVDIRNNCKDPNSRRFTTHYLCKLIVMPVRILYVAMKRDVLLIAITLIRKTEKTGIELTEYRRAVERAVGKDGDAEDENLDQLFAAASEHRKVLAQSFVDQLSYYLTEEKVQLFKGYELFSMDKMALEVDSEAELENYGRPQEEILIKIFCEPVTYTAQWPEKKGHVFSADPLGSAEELHDQLYDLKVQMYEFVKLSPAKRSTSAVLLRLLKAGAPCLRNKPMIRKIVKGYLELPLSTSGVECVFSSVKLTDTRLCMRRVEQTVNQYISIIMESEPFESFDVDLALTIWEKEKRRRVALAVGSRKFDEAVPLLRSMAKKAAGRERKFEARTRFLHKSLPGPLPDLVTDATATDDEEAIVVLHQDDWFGADDDDVFQGFSEEDFENSETVTQTLGDTELLEVEEEFEGFDCEPEAMGPAAGSSQ